MRNQRVILAAVIPSLFGAGMMFAQQKGWFDWFPDWGVALCFIATVWLAVYWLALAPQVRKRVMRYGRMTMAAFIIVGMVLGGGSGWLMWWAVRRSFPQATRSELQTRRDLYIKLSGLRTERKQRYGEEFVANLKFVTGEAQASNPRFPATTRQQLIDESKKSLAALEAMQEGPLAKHQRDFSETLAQVRLVFPETPELNGLLSAPAARPEWNIEDPRCPNTGDMACMQEWATSEAKKAQDVLDQHAGKIDALLRYMQAHLAD